MSIEEDCMEECDGCGNFMFECNCYEIDEEELLPTKLQVCPKCDKMNFQCECEDEETDSGLIRESVKKLARESGTICLKVYLGLSLNSYERNYLFEFLDNETLIHVSKQYMKNFSFHESKYPSTYEEVVLIKLFPELLSRLEKL